MARIAGRTISREQVAQAAWRVILREGLHNASVRAIAAELGATTGVVTYHFRDKADLLLFALDRLGAAILREIDESLEGAVGVERIWRILEATLPVGPAQVAGWRIWVAFVGHALNNKRLREEHQRRLDILNERFAVELEALRAAGSIPADIDARAEADALVALSDGLGLGHLLRPKVYPPAVQRQIVARYLESRGVVAAGTGPQVRAKPRRVPTA